MATQIIPHRPSNHNDNQTRREEALRIAQARLNALSPAEMLNTPVFFDPTGMEDPYRFNRETARPWR